MVSWLIGLRTFESTLVRLHGFSFDFVSSFWCLLFGGIAVIVRLFWVKVNQKWAFSCKDLSPLRIIGLIV